MGLSIPQMAAMSRLLDEALPLDVEGRRAWVEGLPPEHRDLASALRAALLPDEVQAAEAEALRTLPTFGAAGLPGAAVASGLEPGARVGPYQLIRVLGTGGMAEVWLARRADGAFKREAALKLPLLNLLRADLKDRFARECDILASLEHPHIARLYDAGVDANGLPYLSMEYVPGRPLTEWCDAHRLGISARVELFLQVLGAVHYAHDRGVVHRDIKPSNVLVTESGQVRLVDFGVASLMETDAALTQLTNVHGRAVTPDYASPELLRGEPIDARSDVYSLGVLLYEVLTGVRPYRLQGAASIGVLEHAVTTVEVTKPSARCDRPATAARGTTLDKLTRQLQGDLDAIALKSLAKEPAQRYPSAAALAEDLQRHLDGKPVGALPARVTWRRFVRRPMTVAGIAVTAAAATVAAVAFILRGPLHAASELWRNPLAETTFTRLSDFAGTEQAAAISHDGRSVAFLADRDGHLDAWLTDIGSNRYRNLTEGKLRDLSNSALRTVAFSPDDTLVTLWTRKGDGSRPDDVNVVGAPAAGGPLQPYLPDIAEFDWSPDGKRLVFHTTAPGDPYFVRAQGEATAHRIFVAPPGVHCHFPTWSPDGEFIYFARGVPATGVWDLWRLRPSGEGLERLSFHNSRVSHPVLLDAQTLLYLATDTDGSGPWLYAMDLPRRRTHRVSVGLERYTSLAVSADRRRLVATVASARSELWRVTVGGPGPPASTAERVAAATPSAVAPRFGPDYIAFASTGGPRRGIWKLAHGTAKELWSDAEADRVGAPAVAPDGRRIAFTVVDRQGATRLYVIDSDGGQVTVVTTSLALRGALGWAPDAQSIVSSLMRDGEPRLARIFLDGSPPQPMASEYSVDPVWSPDGQYFVYSGPDVGTAFPLRAAAPDGRPYGMPSLILSRGAHAAFLRSGSLVILRGEYTHKNFWAWDPKTGAERQLTDLPSSFVIGDFDVSPDGAEIIFDRVQENSSLALIERTR